MRYGKQLESQQYARTLQDENNTLRTELADLKLNYILLEHDASEYLSMKGERNDALQRVEELEAELAEARESYERVYEWWAQAITQRDEARAEAARLREERERIATLMARGVVRNADDVDASLGDEK